MNEFNYKLGAHGFRKDNSFEDKRNVTVDDTTAMKKKMSNYLGQFKNAHPQMMTNAYWCRDQNFRKYFATRKAHGIAPSTDIRTFYNRDKAEAYYDGQLELARMQRQGAIDILNKK